MEQHTQINLIETVLKFEDGKTTDMLTECSSIKTNTYTDPELFTKESKMIRRLPTIIGHISQIPEPGDFITRRICNVPVLVLRQANGQIKAFINVCKHRGGKLIREEQGSNLRVLVCHYHAWTYETSGKLRGVPHKDGFTDMPDRCKQLTELPLSCELGFLWLRLSPLKAGETAAEFSQQVIDYLGDEVFQDLSALNLEQHVIFDPVDFHRPINWKLAIDTFLENYHVRKTHKDTIDAMFLDNIGCYEKFGLQQRNFYPKKTIVKLKGTPKEQWQLREHGNLLYVIFPNTLILVEPDHINVSIVHPDGIEHTELVNFTLLPEAADAKSSKYFRRNNKILYAALEEDFSMATDIQQGLQSGACEEFLHGRFEQGLKYYHENIQEMT